MLPAWLPKQGASDQTWSILIFDKGVKAARKGSIGESPQRLWVQCYHSVYDDKKIWVAISRYAVDIYKATAC